MAIEIKREEYEKFLKYNYSPSTIKSYLWAFDKFSNNLLDEEGIKEYLIERCYSEKRNPLYMGFIKGFIECFDLPFRIVRPKKRLFQKKKDYTYLDKPTIDMLIKKLPPYYAMVVRILFETGLRRTELIDIKRKKIDLNKRTIKGIGKGNKEFLVKFSPTSQLKLTSYLEDFQGHHPFRHGRRNKDHARSLYYNLKRQCEDLGIPNVHPHLLRHSLGHYLSIEKNLPMPLVKAKLRHSQLSSTERYAAATDADVNKTIDEEIFGGL